jgi:hypothetical protein
MPTAIKTSAVLFISAMLFACSEVRYNYDEMEMNYNYMLLKAYFYKPERIKDISEYEGMEIYDMYRSLYDTLERNGKIYIFTYYEPPTKNIDDIISGIEDTKKYYSFGFERKKESDTIIVSAVYPVSPAAAGLKKRDKLLFANNVSLTNMSSLDLDSILKSDDFFDDSTVFVVLRGEKDIITLPTMVKTEIQDNLSGLIVPKKL